MEWQFKSRRCKESNSFSYISIVEYILKCEKEIDESKGIDIYFKSWNHGEKELLNIDVKYISSKTGWKKHRIGTFDSLEKDKIVDLFRIVDKISKEKIKSPIPIRIHYSFEIEPRYWEKK